MIDGLRWPNQQWNKRNAYAMNAAKAAKAGDWERMERFIRLAKRAWVGCEGYYRNLRRACARAAMRAAVKAAA